MKKTILFCLLTLLIVGIMVSCSSSPKETTNGATKGSATVESNSGRNSCGWVQLWEGGPKWAEFNIGSTIDSYSTITEYKTENTGGYYQWGGTKNSDNNQTSGITNSSSTSDISGTGTAGGTVGSLGDTAKILWGANWKMPTKAELEALKDNCTWIWCDGTNSKYEGSSLVGYKVNGKGVYADNSIFLPAAGYTDLEPGSNGGYWSSTPVSSSKAYELLFSSSTKNVNYTARGCGYSVRAVLAK